MGAWPCGRSIGSDEGICWSVVSGEGESTRGRSTGKEGEGPWERWSAGTEERIARGEDFCLLPRPPAGGLFFMLARALTDCLEREREDRNT